MATTTGTPIDMTEKLSDRKINNPHKMLALSRASPTVAYVLFPLARSESWNL